MLELYGGLRSQIVTPVVHDGAVVAIVSLHQLGRTRTWSAAEIAAGQDAADRIGALL
jgi:GAF domain-containing protein